MFKKNQIFSKKVIQLIQKYLKTYQHHELFLKKNEKKNLKPEAFRKRVRKYSVSQKQKCMPQQTKRRRADLAKAVVHSFIPKNLNTLAARRFASLFRVASNRNFMPSDRGQPQVNIPRLLRKKKKRTFFWRT